MLVRNVKAGESCQLRVMVNGKYRWTTIKVTRLAFGVVWYEFNGESHGVARGFVDWHWWEVKTSEGILNFKVGISFTARTHGKSSWSVGIDVADAVGVQWDGFKGSIRTGKGVQS